MDEPLEELRVCLPSCVWQAGHSLRAPTSLHALADILQPFAVKDALLGRSGNAQESAGVSLPTAQRRRPQGLRRRFASQEIVDKVVTCVELCIGIRVACIGNAYSCAYAIQAATGQVVWPRAGRLHAMHLHLPCLPLHGAVRPRATWRHAPVHAHGHNQCSSSLRGLDSCISATGTDIT